MAVSIRTVDYYCVMCSNRPGSGASLLEELRGAGVNFLAVHAFPEKRRTQVDLVPERAGDMLRAAKRLGVQVSKKKKAFLASGDDRAGRLAGIMGKLGAAKINVTAVTALCVGKGRFGAILWVKAKDQRRAARALGAR
ncbi:MAG: hypothetical protein O2807_01295 [bacterium]|nr:hypothetical protein [bacterium]